MKERTRKMLLIITLVLAGFTIVAKTILNSDYYNIVKAINKNYETQNPIDYQDEETNIENNTDNQEIEATGDNKKQEGDNNEIVDTNVVEDESDQNQSNNTEETTMPSRPIVEM